MIELLFVVCLSSEPASCRDRSMIFTEDIGLMGCMMGAQSQLAKWVETRPQERIVSWRCKAAGASERSA
ncbi:hypothetical protein E4L95_03560 [Paracoccus liaowanqingii]|uniref:Uncharacterized protein n=1 Tax=Paracoccus liaowanqingii TaxID=2560053 RepID=A0A4P7HIE4_9RHOB|nr:hypothetical protein [Paracoccus liaowanqingii]QBX33849.1 hypothetical protein E4191_03275 [Paracoccus liaowanqingii]TGN67832.1 hypothetical protein E4L95_03560 [Paracoccus liaowanqingii]